jgi:hypothetical protein
VITPDVINGIFEVCGSVAVWLNFAAILKDRGYAGTRVPMMAFFTSWGFWNLFFYSHLMQWVSLYASVLLTSGNVAVIAAMLYFGRKK